MKEIKGFSGTFKSEVIPQPEVYTDETLAGAAWEEYGISMSLSTTSKESYPVHTGKCISGRHCGYIMSTALGDFVTEQGIRGETQAVIVFSNTGKGYVFS